MKPDLRLLPQTFTVCKIASPKDVDLTLPYCFAGKTETELSLVCPTEFLPESILQREDGWRGLFVAGTLDLSLTGILSGISGVLAAAEVGIFAVSTFDTDYIFVKEAQLERAIGALGAAGYRIVRFYNDQNGN